MLTPNRKSNKKIYVAPTVANGYYDSKENIVNFLEAGTPVDTMQLKLK